jgi:hypothetical protein
LPTYILRALVFLFLAQAVVHMPTVLPVGSCYLFILTLVLKFWPDHSHFGSLGEDGEKTSLSD